MTYTNKQLHEDIQSLRKDTNKGFDKMRLYVDNKIAPLHDFMIGQQAIDGLKVPSNISTKDLTVFILKLMGIILAIVTAVAGINHITK